MSEPAPEPGPGTGAGDIPIAEMAGMGNGETPDPEDDDAQGLLGSMMDQDPEELQRQLDHWKGQARKWEGRASQNKDAAARLKEIEDANKTELEKAQEALAEAISQRDNATWQHNRVMAAAAFDLPTELVEHLGSGTPEEIAERAELFSTIINNRAQQLADDQMSRNGYVPSSGMRPVESMRPGSAPVQGGTPITADDWFRQMLSTPDQ